MERLESYLLLRIVWVAGWCSTLSNLGQDGWYSLTCIMVSVFHTDDSKLPYLMPYGFRLWHTRFFHSIPFDKRSKEILFSHVIFGVIGCCVYEFGITEVPLSLLVEAVTYVLN